MLTDRKMSVGVWRIALGQIHSGEHLISDRSDRADRVCLVNDIRRPGGFHEIGERGNRAPDLNVARFGISHSNSLSVVARTSTVTGAGSVRNVPGEGLSVSDRTFA